MREYYEQISVGKFDNLDEISLKIQLRIIDR